MFLHSNAITEIKGKKLARLFLALNRHLHKHFIYSLGFSICKYDINMLLGFLIYLQFFFVILGFLGVFLPANAHL